MQDLFVKESDEFVVKIVVATDKQGTIFCDLNKESLIESFGNMIKDMEIKEYEASFKRPSFGDSVGLYGSIFKVTDNDVNFNPVQARFNKISALIKKWNLKGQDEKPTTEDIRSLHPTIATAFGIVIDKETGGLFG
jgi:hypothetical protein